MKKSFVLYLDQYSSIKKLSDEQSGILLKAMFEFHLGNEFEITDPVVDMALSFLGETFKRDSDKYLKICEKNKENARIRWDKKNATASDRISKNAKHADSDSDTIVIVAEDSDNKKAEFEKFWDMYDKKEDRKKCLTKWKNLKVKDKELIFKTVSIYVASTPDKKYRKNPLTWLNGECWNNEVENKQSKTDISTESWF